MSQKLNYEKANSQEKANKTIALQLGDQEILRSLEGELDPEVKAILSKPVRESNRQKLFTKNEAIAFIKDMESYTKQIVELEDLSVDAVTDLLLSYQETKIYFPMMLPVKVENMSVQIEKRLTKLKNSLEKPKIEIALKMVRENFIKEYRPIVIKNLNSNINQLELLITNKKSIFSGKDYNQKVKILEEIEAKLKNDVDSGIISQQQSEGLEQLIDKFIDSYNDQTAIINKPGFNTFEIYRMTDNYKSLYHRNRTDLPIIFKDYLDEIDLFLKDNETILDDAKDVIVKYQKSLKFYYDQII